MSRYQKVKTNLDFTEARDSEWQWHQLGHMQLCTLLQTDNHASTPPLSFFTGRMPFLQPNQQRQSNEGQTVDGKLITLSVHLCTEHDADASESVRRGGSSVTGDILVTASVAWSPAMVVVRR